jgi:hypothetical protein
VLTGCGEKKSAPSPTHTRTASPTAAADCLNSDGFLVEAARGAVRGSSPTGVNFTIRFYKSTGATNAAFERLRPRFAAMIAMALVDFAGNPPAHAGGPARVLDSLDLRTIKHCVELR